MNTIIVWESFLFERIAAWTFGGVGKAECQYCNLKFGIPDRYAQAIDFYRYVAGCGRRMYALKRTCLLVNPFLLTAALRQRA